MLWMRAAGWGLALLICTAVEAAAASPKRVLVLHSFGHDFAPFANTARTFRTELVKQSVAPIDFYEASIFTARFPEADRSRFLFGFPETNQGPFLSGFREPEEEMALVEYLRDVFSRRKLDLVVTLGTPATRLAQRHRPRIFPDTPMLITGSTERRLPGTATSLTANDTVVAQKIDIPAYIDNILRLRPDTNNIVVVIGDSPLERFWAAEAARAIEPFAGRLTFTWFNKLSLDDMVQQAAALPARSVILYSMVAVDGGGTPHPLDRAFERIRAVAKVPIFGHGDHLLGYGIVGGPLAPVLEQGREAARVALRILNGEKPGDIQTPPIGFGPPAYDWRELRRWDISEALLPPGSVVHFREPTAWERYRWQIVLVAAVLLVQGSLIGLLLYQRRRLRQAEMDIRHRAAELAHMNRRTLAGELSASIAHEINQPLAAIVSSGSAGLRWLAAKTPDLEEVASSLKRVVDDGHRAAQIVNSIRTMLKKEDAANRTLVDVNRLVADVLDLMRSDFESGHVLPKSVQTQGLPAVLVDRVQLQQVILNLIRNAIDAVSSVTDRERILRIRTEADETGDVIISIEDTGPGIDPSNVSKLFEPFFTTKPQGMGMGLSICRSIIEAHGGRLSAIPGRPHGAVFQIVLPTPP